MARLIYRADTGETCECTVGEKVPVVVIGRHKTCAIRTRNTTVSRRHAQVSWIDGAYQLLDLGSSNGTYFSKQRIAEHWLEDDNLFQCGAFSIQFCLEEHEKFADEEVLVAEEEILAIEALQEAVAAQEPSEMYPVAEELDEEGISFGFSTGDDPFESPPLADLALPGSADAAESAEPVMPPPIPPTMLPFEPPSFEPPSFEPPSLESSVSADGSPVLDAAPPFVDAPDAKGSAERVDDSGSRSHFDEFNRQLEAKDEQLATLRDEARAREQRIILLEAQVEALSHAVEDANQDGSVSTAEFTALTAENSGLAEQLAATADELSVAKDRLQSMEAQILRVQEEQPSEAELTELREALAERNRLWDDREAKEHQIVELKRKLESAQTAADHHDHDDGGETVALRAELETQAALIDSLRSRMGELEGELLDKDTLRLDAEDRALEAEDRVRALGEQLEDAQDETARLENRVDQMEEGHQAEAALRIELERAQADLEDEKARVAEGLEALERAREAQTSVAEARDGAARERDELREMLSDRTEMEQVEEKLGSLRNQLRLIEEERDELKTSRDETRAQREGLTAEQERLERENAELKELLAGMPDEETVATVESARNKAEHERDALRDDNAQLERRLERAERRVVEAEDRADKAHSSATGLQSDMEAQLAEVQERARGLQGKVEELEDVLVAAPSQTEFEQLKTQLKTVKKERDTLKEKVSREGRKVAKLERQVAGLQDGAASDKTKIGELEGALSDARAAQKAAEKALKDQERRAEKALAAVESKGAEVERRAAAAEAALKAETDRADELGRSLAAAESRVAGLEKELRAARKAAKAGGAAISRSEELASALAEVEEERDDLHIVIKGHVKRNAALLKKIDTLEEGVRVRARAAVSQERLDHVETQLDEALSARDAALSELEAVQRDVDSLEDDLSRVRAELDARGEAGQEAALHAQLQSLQEELAAAKTAERPAPSASGAVRDMDKLRTLIEDINDRVSSFQNNCDTVLFCIEDLESGVGTPAEHYTTAKETLQTTGDDVDSIKGVLRRYRREHLT